jgi:hypothetical protein
MAKQLTIDEMLSVLKEIDHRSYEHHKEAIEAIGSLMAIDIARALHVTTGPATFQGVALAGTCAPFEPSHSGQVCPDPLSKYDPSEWGTC